MKISYRTEKLADIQGIQQVHDLAFRQTDEGELAGKLRRNQLFNSKLSIVADWQNEIVGHILFFPIKIDNGKRQYSSLALAPMSVLPELQGMGIGTGLVKAGIETALKLGHQSVIVLGHPKYYSRFGFKRASDFEIQCSFEVPDEAFMALELVEEALQEVSGTVQYPKEFGV